MADPFPELEGVLFLNQTLRREAEARVLAARLEQQAKLNAASEVSRQAALTRLSPRLTCRCARKLSFRSPGRFRVHASKLAVVAGLTRMSCPSVAGGDQGSGKEGGKRPQGRGEAGPGRTEVS